MSKEVTVGNKKVTIRELTMRQVTEHLDGEVDSPTIADLMMNHPIPERVVRLATGLETEDLNGDVLPSQLSALWEEVARVNPFLEALLQRLQTAGGGDVEAERGLTGEELRRIACTLARACGHSGVIDYPWSWFVSALAEAAEAKEKQQS